KRWWSLGKHSNKLKDYVTEKRNLNFEFYLNTFTKDQYIRIYDVLKDTHDYTFKAVYERLNTRTDEVEAELVKEAENVLIDFNYIDPDYFDYGDYADSIREYVYERLDEQFLMHYQFELMSLSNLYQVFEQQLRKWLYEAMTHHFNEYINQVQFTHVDNKNKNAYDNFFNNFGKLTDLFTALKLTFTNPFGDEELIVETDIWKMIRECNLLSNTYKHGSGHSATNLYEAYPQYFKKVNSTRLMDLYRTTNLERVLDVDKISFGKYSNAMKEFWKSMKEHQNGTLLMNVRTSS
ncbi:hypothetical protein OCF63_13315, partial [Bacillus wiedmannii]|uniref:hypothetical protein n=1 Tax=Bacillus wiedmannii TaxID=1890302 RepID=UPI0021CE498D